MKIINFKIYLLISIFILSNVHSQDLSEQWVNIHQDDLSALYIEPSKIVEYGNEISVWAIEKLNEVKISQDNEKVKTIKTHYLFNKLKKRYAEIGIIYYDEKGGIVNRSSKSNFSTGPAAFMTPISSNNKTEIIYREVISYLITGEIKKAEVDDILIEEPQIESESLSQKSNDLNLTEDRVTKPILSPKAKVAEENNSDEQNKTEILQKNVDDSHESWNEIPQISNKAEVIEKPKLEYDDRNEHITETEIESINIQLPKNEYNVEKERPLKNAIFTDGKLYCFQVSSWKTKSYAERELQKLLKKGINAYIISVKPKNKKDIWHRVRVGFFNSLEEAARVKRNIK